MTTAVRALRPDSSAEVALAFLASATTFALVGVAVAAIESHVPVLLLAVGLVGAVLAIANGPGVAYAFPVAMAGVLAYDWYYVPPTHADEFPDSANLGRLLVYLALAVLIGQVASRAGRRAAVSDAVRSELTEQQGSLRRIATLVARGVPPPEVFEVVAREIRRVLRVDVTHIGRYDPDDTLTGIASWSAAGDHSPAGARVSLEGESVSALVLRTGRPARVDRYDDAAGPIAAATRDLGVRSSVGAPIVVDGRLWGVAIASSKKEEPLPRDTESRIGAFTELVATAISNAQARVELARLAEEQAALRRVATLVAHGAPPGSLFAVVAEQVTRVLNVAPVSIVRYEDDGSASERASFTGQGELFAVGTRWPLDGTNVVAQVLETGRPARINDYSGLTGEIAETARRIGIRSTVGIPIVVAGRLWGAMVVSSTELEPLPEDTEGRLTDFNELVATAIANSDAREEVQRLADEHAALRRVATLVARQAPQAEVFHAIAEEIGQLLGTEQIRMLRYEGDRSAVVVGSSGNDDVVPLGSRQHLDGDTAASRVLQTGRTARIADYGTASGPLAESARSIGIHSAVGAPILVQGRLWGAIVTGTSREEPPPPETESRLGQFTELMATAIGNTEARAEVERLADEQAALRRVATLVAKESSPAEVFAKVAEELSNVLGDVDCSLFCDEGDGTASAVALSGAGASAGVRVGTRLPVDGDGVIACVLREGRPCRIGDYSAATGAIAQRGRELGVRSAVGCPIVVGGRIWGAMGAARYDAEALPPETETRIAQFADLVATAIANAEARTEVERLVEEQAALRRVATLVAEGASPSAVFDAVAGEMEALLGADVVTLNRYEPGAEIVVLAHRGPAAARTLVGRRVSHEGPSVSASVRRTGRPARVVHSAEAPGAVAEQGREIGLHVSVGAPIVVEGRVWGLITAAWKGEESPLAGTEERMVRFAELLETAIANADGRDQLTASRARLLTEGDEARRRVVRDLHDGAQQRLVHAIVTLKLAQRAFREDDGKAESLIGEALDQAEQGNAELRELAHGILPSVLTHGGLRPGVEAVVTRVDLPVKVDVPAERFAAEIEASAYFIVAEALTNVVKHSHAGRAEVGASVKDRMLHVEVRDDGIGGADPGGHGLVGIGDRVTALGGRFKVESPPGGGTLVAATLPLSAG